MPASSATGTGPGASNKPTTTELAALANGPSIIFSGRVESTSASSPPLYTNSVTFPYALEGGAEKYVTLLTTLNAGYIYLSDEDEDDDGNYTGFSFVSETDGTVMYLVAKTGSKPNL